MRECPECSEAGRSECRINGGRGCDGEFPEGFECPTCRKPIGKWDRIFARLLKGEEVRLATVNDTKNVHHMAEKRGVRVTVSDFMAKLLVVDKRS
jgi:hypothetical protein